MVKKLLLTSVLLGGLAGPLRAGSSYAPIFGVDNVFGPLYGAAAFFYNEGENRYKLDSYAASSFSGFDLLLIDVEKNFGVWKLDGSLNVQRSFNNYYGEGGDTPDRILLKISHNKVQPELALLRKAGRWNTGPRLRWKIRDERETRLVVDPDDDEKDLVTAQVVPGESTPALAWVLEYDARNKILNTTDGYLLKSSVEWIGGGTANKVSAWHDAMQLELEVRHFKKIFWKVILASRAIGTWTDGDTTYLYRLSLGGAEQLRGFGTNRFRGRRRWVITEELRIPIWKMFSTNVSVDIGSVGDPDFEKVHSTFQAGLRVGLPPDWGMRARMDFGWSKDQAIFQMEFGELF